MKRLLPLLFLSAGILPAIAADLPPRAAVQVKAATVAAAPSPFFIGINGGMALTTQEYDFITSPGTASGTNKFYPAGGLAGLTAGVGSTFGGFYGELYVDADYVLNRNSTQGIDPNGNPATLTTKNSFEFKEGVFVGIPLTTLTSAIPQQAAIPAPSSWPIPVSVPQNLSMASFVIGPEFGVAERQVHACAVPTDPTLSGACADRWLYGPYVGGRAMYKISANWALKLSYDHLFLDSSWSNPGAAGVLGVGARIVNTDEFRAGLNYSF